MSSGKGRGKVGKKMGSVGSEKAFSASQRLDESDGDRPGSTLHVDVEGRVSEVSSPLKGVAITSPSSSLKRALGLTYIEFLLIGLLITHPTIPHNIHYPNLNSTHPHHQAWSLSLRKKIQDASLWLWQLTSRQMGVSLEELTSVEELNMAFPVSLWAYVQLRAGGRDLRADQWGEWDLRKRSFPQLDLVEMTTEGEVRFRSLIFPCPPSTTGLLPCPLPNCLLPRFPTLAHPYQPDHIPTFLCRKGHSVHQVCHVAQLRLRRTPVSQIEICLVCGALPFPPPSNSVHTNEYAWSVVFFAGILGIKTIYYQGNIFCIKMEAKFEEPISRVLAKMIPMVEAQRWAEIKYLRVQIEPCREKLRMLLEETVDVMEDEMRAMDEDTDEQLKTADQVAEELKQLIAEELDIPLRGPHGEKPNVLFKQALYSRILEMESPASNQRLYVMVWITLEVQEDADANMDVRPVVKSLLEQVRGGFEVLLSDAFERRDVQTEIPGEKIQAGWLARQSILDVDKIEMRKMLELPGDLFACLGTDSKSWPQRGMILDPALLWSLAEQLPEVWKEMTGTLERMRRVLALHPAKTQGLVAAFLKAKTEGTRSFPRRY